MKLETALETLHWGTLNSLSENNTLPQLKMCGDMVDVDGQLISLKTAREIQDSAHDIYLTHLQIVEETKHRFVVEAMKSLRKFGYVKKQLFMPLMLEKHDIIECINMARNLVSKSN